MSGSERTKKPGAQKTQPGDPPTKRQKAVLEAIVALTAEKGFAPTIRELGRRIGCSSPNGVMCHMTALKKKGLLTFNSNQARTMRVVEVPKKG